MRGSKGLNRRFAGDWAKTMQGPRLQYGKNAARELHRLMYALYVPPYVSFLKGQCIVTGDFPNFGLKCAKFICKHFAGDMNCFVTTKRTTSGEF